MPKTKKLSYSEISLIITITVMIVSAVITAIIGSVVNTNLINK